MQPQLIAGRYMVLRAIGRGGMGTVWLCRDEILGREVAVKQIGALLGESASETKRAMREARSAAALNHPNAVAVYDVVNHDGGPWLVMEYVEGQTLADEISRDGRLSPQRVADIGAQLASALARAHERRIVHRDIKPGNVLIDKAGRPKISDFGIARGHGDEQLTQIGFITGTPGYLSPELARGGDPHPASDVWALGATLYEAVEGRSAYEPKSNPIAVLRAIATERPRPMTHAGALGYAIETMMHEDPDRRWDMATSAKRLGGVARITMVMPRVDPDRTAVVAAPPLVPTQRLEVTAPMAVAPVVHAPTPVVPVVPEPAATARMSVLPVVRAPIPVAPDPAVPLAVAPVAVAPAIETSPDGRRSVPRWLLLALVALLLAVLGGVYLQNVLGDQGGPATVANPTSTAPKTSAQPRPASSTPPGAVSPAPSSVAAASGRKADKKLEDFVKSYYSDVTDKRDHAWAQLTPRMQERAGGRDGYDGFWRTIDKVEVNDTRANAGANSATANLTFSRRDGTTSTENYQFSFVAGGGEGYLIDGDKLLR